MPGYTSIVSPISAASIAAWILTKFDELPGFTMIVDPMPDTILRSAVFPLSYPILSTAEMRKT